MLKLIAVNKTMPPDREVCIVAYSSESGKALTVSMDFRKENLGKPTNVHIIDFHKIAEGVSTEEIVERALHDSRQKN